MPSFDEAATIFLGLSRIKGIGFKTLRDFGGVDAIASDFIRAPQDFLERITRSAQSSSLEGDVWQYGREAFKRISELEIRLVKIGDPLYPKKFLSLDEKSRPLWFFYRGNSDLLTRDAIAVVGTRNPSKVGVFLTQYAISAARELNALIVSGLAKGIDETAHEWALTCGLPNISVLANGLMRTYPPSNVDLANRIVEAGGLLLSEYLPTAQPSAESFVWRNRLQAALANCVIGPEWKRSSGTAHTMRFARRMSRTTINTQLNGIPLSEDHGEADLVFELPKDHTLFIDAIARTIDSNARDDQFGHKGDKSSLPLQGDLF